MNTGHKVTDRNFWVLTDKGAPPDKANRSLPPRVSLNLLNISRSISSVHKCCFMSQALIAKALWKVLFALGEAVDNIASMLLWIDSQTRGVPIIKVGLNSFMSPLHLRTEWSVKVRTEPYPNLWKMSTWRWAVGNIYVTPQKMQRFSVMNSMMWENGR